MFSKRVFIIKNHFPEDPVSEPFKVTQPYKLLSPSDPPLASYLGQEQISRDLNVKKSKSVNTANLLSSSLRLTNKGLKRSNQSSENFSEASVSRYPHFKFHRLGQFHLDFEFTESSIPVFSVTADPNSPGLSRAYSIQYLPYNLSVAVQLQQIIFC